MTPDNHAAWTDKAGIPLAIRSTPYPSTLPPNHILIKASAWGINPADLAVADVGLPSITYPLVLGEDVSGPVVASSHPNFKPNDRVLAVCTGSAVGKNEMGGFQEYVIVDGTLASKIPDTMSWEEGVVFPLCLATAAHALFSRDFLNLPDPKTGNAKGGAGQTLLIWGASSGVGSNAIQMAVAAGVEVIATAGPKNFEYVKALGASRVFDYASESVVEDVLAAIEKNGRPCAGIFQAQGSVEACMEVSQKAKGNLFVATASLVPEKVPEGVTAKMALYSASLDENETADAVFGKFLPQALQKGSYKVVPKPLIVGTKGLEGVQEGFETLKKGVSATKVVVLA